MQQTDPPAAGPPGAKNRMARNSAIGTVAYGLNVLLMLVALRVLAGALGKDLLGQYFTVVILVTLIQFTLECGIVTVLTHRIAKQPDDWRRDTAEAAGLLIPIAAFSFAAMMLAGVACSAWRQDAAYVAYCAIGGAACIAIHVQQFCFAVFRGFQRFEYEGWCKILQGFAFVGLVLLAWAMLDDLSVMAALAAFTGSQIIATVFIVWLLPRGWSPLDFRFDRSVIGGWLRAALPLGAGDVLRRSSVFVDHVSVILLQPSALVGIYGVASRLHGPMTIIPRAVVSAAFPVMTSHAAAHDLEGARRLYCTSVRWLYVLAVPVTVSIVMLAPALVQLLTGGGYDEAVLPMQILAVVYFWSFPSSIFRIVLTAYDKQRTFAWLVVAGLVLKLIMVPVLCYTHGVIGAAVGFTLGEACFTILGYLVCTRYGMPLGAWTSVFRVLPAGAAVGLGLWACLDHPPLFQFAVAAALSVFYAAVCVMTGAINSEESGRVLSIITRRDPRIDAPAGAALEQKK